MKDVNLILEIRDWNGGNDLALRDLVVGSLPFGDQEGRSGLLDNG